MIAMAIDGPMSEQNRRLLSVQNIVKALVPGSAQFCGTVDLAGKDRACFQYFARFQTFGRANRRSFRCGFAFDPGFPARQVEKHHFMPQVGVARDRTPAA